MKKFKTGLVALALVFGISGAVVAKVQASPKVFDDLYNWSQSANAPENPGTTLTQQSVDTAIDHYGCETGSSTCAVGTDPNGINPQVTLRFN